VNPYDMIKAERARQIAKGYDAAHDEQHEDGELAAAAAAFAAVESKKSFCARQLWPFDGFDLSMENPTLNNLTKAGALIVAEMERVMRRDSMNAEIVSERSIEDIDRVNIELADERERAAIANAGLNQAVRMISEGDDHIRALLDILDRTGGFTSPADQETIRKARQAVARG